MLDVSSVMKSASLITYEVFNYLGLSVFALKHDSVTNWLLAHGWTYNENRKKWEHYE